MNKHDVISFFDRLAPHWDGDLQHPDEVIDRILDNAGVTAGVSVLDVACGTGVLFPDYLRRNVGALTGIDISPEMVRVAQRKFPQIEVLCQDVEHYEPETRFDCIVVYNAFPHFPEPEALLRKLTGLLKPGGRLTVAHGMSREAIDSHHEGTASKVSIGLMHEDALAAMFRKYLHLTTKISNNRMYQLVGQLEK